MQKTALYMCKRESGCKTMADLIDRAALLEQLESFRADEKWRKKRTLRERWLRTIGIDIFAEAVKKFPAVDAVEVETLKAWLYEIAMNNTSNYLGDACEVIISRLDGLRVFARERRTDGSTD